MNRYGKMAWDHWRRYRQKAMEQIVDQVGFFANLGETAADHIEQMSEAILRKSDPSADFMTEVARREQAQRTAEELVLSELILLPEEQTAEREED